MKVPEKPLMDAPDIVFIEKLLKEFAGKEISVLEWGAGGSTMYFSRFLEFINRKYSWLSIEHDADWCLAVSEKIANNPAIKIIHQPLAAREGEESPYVQYPFSVHRKFDLIIVDGKERSQCLIQAKELLAPGGYIIIHDAERSEYKKAMQKYPLGTIVSPEEQLRKLWVYSDDPAKALRNKKTAVAIFSFNRPEYLKQVLDSIERNSYLDTVDFYMFQDGSVNKFSKRIAADEKDILSCIDLWEKSKLPNKVLIRRMENVGIGGNQYQAKCLLFDGLNYDEVIFLEDDLVLSKDYFRLIRVLLGQFKDEPSVGAVMCHGLSFDKPILSREKKQEQLYELVTGKPHLWGWATWKDRWVKIKPHYLKYYEFINGIDYKSRPHAQILSFFVSEKLNLKSTSQDSGMQYAFFKNDFFLLNTFVNRAKYIGEKGEHMTPKVFKDSNLPLTQLDEFQEDQAIMSFPEINRGQFLALSKKDFIL